MPSLISDLEKAEYENVRDDVFLTFARDFVAYKTPEKVIISSDVNYSFSYDAPDGVLEQDYVQYVPKSMTFKGCILYDKILDKLFANQFGKREEDIRITLKEGMVRLKIQKEAWDFLKDAIDFQFDGYHFDLFKMERPHGLFSPKYYTLYLKVKN